MQLTITDSTGMEYGDAYYLATASLLAYTVTEEDVKTEFADTLGLTVETHTRDNTGAVVGWNDTAIVIAFRGSQSPLSTDGLKDWLVTNARTKLIIPGGKIGDDFLAASVDARFHQGFLDALDNLWDAFFPTIEAETNAKDRPVWVTGHSLGGALATLAAWRLKRKGIKIHQVYTFAAPMFCNIDAVEAYNLRLVNRIHRFANERDIVPLLPVSDVLNNQYRQVGTEEILPGDGGGASAKDLWGQLLSLAASLVGNNALPSLRSLLWNEVNERAEAHSLSHGYIAKIAEKLKQQGTGGIIPAPVAAGAATE